MAESLYRQWMILQVIPKEPHCISIKQIIHQLEIQGLELPSYRTIQRDLDTLGQVFHYLNNEKREGAHCWFVAQDEVLEIPKMESSTALAFYLAQKNLQNQFPPSAYEHLQAHFNTANSILQKQNSGYAHWREKIRVLAPTQQLIAPVVDADVLTNIYTALLENKCFMAKYYARRAEHYKCYQINPIALIFRGTVTYLVCTINDYTDLRLMSLHRFVEATITNIPSITPSGFNVDNYIKEGHTEFLLGDYIDLELIIDEEVAIHLRESRLSENQQMIALENGQSTFQAYVQNTGQLRWWLLGFAEQIEVIKPEELREEFRRKTRAMVAKYSS